MKGVYFLIKDQDVIYIGQSIHIEKRVKDHCLLGYDSFVLLPCRNRKRMERKMIKLIRPIHNMSHLVPDRFSTNLRINSKLAERVKASAEAAKRSMNKEIELVLEERYL